MFYDSSGNVLETITNYGNTVIEKIVDIPTETTKMGYKAGDWASGSYVNRLYEITVYEF